MPLISAERIIDGTGTAFDGVAMLVEDGWIRAVGRPADFGETVAERHHHPGASLMPGLIDSHAHLEFTPLDEHRDVIDRLASDETAGRLGALALHHAQQTLIGGVTTVRDCGSTLSLLAVRDLIRAGVPGPRIVACGPPITVTAGHLFWVGRRADTDDAVRVEVRRLVERDVDAIKIVATGGQMTEGSNQLAPQFTQSQVSAGVEEAHRLGRRVVAHVLNVAGIEQCVLAGVDSIDHCRWQWPDGSTRYQATLGREVVRSATMVGFTGSGWTRDLLDQGDHGRAELRRSFEAHRALADEGALLHVQSDAGATSTSFGELPKSVSVFMEATGASLAQGLAAITGMGARAIGMEAEIGSLEAGKRADYLVVDGDPHRDITALSSIRQVVVGGTPLVERGRLVVAPSLRGAPEEEHERH